MKTLLPLLLLLVVCCRCLVVTAVLIAPSLPREGCCKGHSRRRVHMNRVTHVRESWSGCKPKSVIITTVRKKVCVDPDLDWVKTLLAAFSKPSATFQKL